MSDQPAATAGVTVTNHADTAAKPVVAVSPAEPPTSLLATDLVVGEGTAATTADTVEVHYLGVHFTDGTEFDSSWAHGSPTSFPLNRVVPGFRDGIAGMQPGGRRLLVLPPHMGYGAAGAPPVIGPNETLVFVVDLIAVR